MNMLNCLIVDDEELARDLVENYINRVPHLQVVGKCSNPLAAMQLLQEKTVDLMFLDIQMPELTGIEFLKTLSQKPLVIFTTAYKEYALEGFDLDVVDYLLKPFRFERFLQAVNKVGNVRGSKSTDTISSDLSAPTPSSQSEASAPSRDYILVKSDFKVFRVFYKDIRYIESMKEYVAYHTSNGRILSLGSLKKLSQDLPKEHFVRIHKSYIANVVFISALEGNMVHIADQKLPIGGSYREEVLKLLF